MLLHPWKPAKALFLKGRVLLQVYPRAGDSPENWGMVKLEKWIEIDRRMPIPGKLGGGAEKRIRHPATCDFLGD